MFFAPTKRRNSRQHQLNMLTAGIALACILTVFLFLNLFGSPDSPVSNLRIQPDATRRPTVSEYLAQEWSRPATETARAPEAEPGSATPAAPPAPPAEKPGAEKSAPAAPSPAASEPSKPSPSSAAPAQAGPAEAARTPEAAAEAPSDAAELRAAEPEAPWPPPDPPAAWAPSPEFSSRFASMIGSLLVIGLVTWGSLKLMGAFFPQLARRKPRASLMEVLERESIAPGIDICLVRVAGKHMVLGMTDQSVNMICELSPEELQAAEPEEDPPAKDPVPAGERGRTYKSIMQHYLSIIPGMGASRK